MSNLNRTDLKEKFNNSGTGLYKTGQSRGIGSDDHRTAIEDVADSHFNKNDDAYNGAKGLKNSLNTIAGLQAVNTVSLSVPLYTVFRDTDNGNVLRVYELVSGTDAETSPTIIRPTDYADSTNEKVWKLADFSGSGNVWNDRGGHDASGGAFPSTGGSGISGAIMRFNAYLVTVEGLSLIHI